MGRWNDYLGLTKTGRKVRIKGRPLWMIRGKKRRQINRARRKYR